jgi:hypothetical protein
MKGIEQQILEYTHDTTILTNEEFISKHKVIFEATNKIYKEFALQIFSTFIKKRKKIKLKTYLRLYGKGYNKNFYKK